MKRTLFFSYSKLLLFDFYKLGDLNETDKYDQLGCDRPHLFYSFYWRDA
jgi:hypothetical protein